MTRGRTAFCIFASVVLCNGVFSATPASAQLATAELNGRVTDSSGGVLPGVTLTATQTAVLVDRAQRRPVPVPEEMRTHQRAFEGSDLVE